MSDQTESRKRFRRLSLTRFSVRKQANKAEKLTIRHAQKFILSRVDNINAVKRFTITWLSVVVLLIIIAGLQLINYQRAFSHISQIPGGTFAEGVVGPLEVINPILASTPAEQSASRLVFSSLFDYDAANHIQGNLAQSWRIENDGLRYVIEMRDAILWQDKQEITADDVTFTISLIKNPLVKSPLYSSWSRIKVTKISERSIAFDLQKPYAAFLHALTFGIMPKHVLSQIPPDTLREADFNRQPIGSGPFQFDRLQVVNASKNRLVIYLKQNTGYHRGTPNINKFQLHVYSGSEQVAEAFSRQEINAAGDLTSDQLYNLIKHNKTAVMQEQSLSSGMFAFFKTDSPNLQDVVVRRALRLAVDRQAIIDRLHGFASILEGPIPVELVATLKTKVQPEFNKNDAGKLLDSAGWQLKNGKRTKEGQLLSIKLVGIKSGDYPVLVEMLKKQWEAIGITVVPQLVDSSEVQQSVIIPRNYDVLVYELAIGGDPDVTAYWHSAQADPRGLNLSNYRSAAASEALSGAQARYDSGLRIPKYETFVDSWLADVPAVALYLPQLHFITTSDVTTLLSNNAISDRTDRYRLVELWTANSGRVYNSP
ncbi:MAG: peptide ABC transporter substrate-binding protein [Candidatus Saccharimonadales bacterium]